MIKLNVKFRRKYNNLVLLHINVNQINIIKLLKIKNNWLVMFLNEKSSVRHPFTSLSQTLSHFVKEKKNLRFNQQQIIYFVLINKLYTHMYKRINFCQSLEIFFFRLTEDLFLHYFKLIRVIRTDPHLNNDFKKNLHLFFK